MATTAGALLFVAVPVADTTIAIVRRRRAGRPLFQGDRGHVYDQLVDRGWSSQRSTLACAVAQAVFVALGLAASTLDGRRRRGARGGRGGRGRSRCAVGVHRTLAAYDEDDVSPLTVDVLGTAVAIAAPPVLLEELRDVLADLPHPDRSADRELTLTADRAWVRPA